MISVTTAATDLNLLTLAELRSATGVESGKDSELTALGRRVASAITAACRVAANGAVPPTLRLETLTETYRLKSRQEHLQLSRSPIVSISSVTEDDDALVAADYEIDGYQFRRLEDDERSSWVAAKIVVVYTAGWATVPDDLRLAAMKLASSYWTEDGREPGLRSMDIPGVYSASYQDKESDNPAIPFDVMQLLEAGGYVNHWVS